MRGPLGRGHARDADEAGQRVARLALADAACAIGTTREELTLALASRRGLDRLVRDAGISEGAIEAGVRRGVERALTEATRRDALDDGLASVLREAFLVLPLDRVVRTLDGTAPPCEPLGWTRVERPEAILAQVVVVGLLETGCALRARPLDVLDALARPDGVARLATATGATPAAAGEAVQTALEDAIREATAAGDLTADVGTALGLLVEATPVDQALAVLRGDASPCGPIAWRPELSSLDAVAAQVALRAITGTACGLDLPVADVAAAIALPDGIAGLAQRAQIDPARADAAARDGLRAGLADARANGAVDGVVADALAAAAAVVPLDRLLATLRGDERPCDPLGWTPTDDAQRTAAQIVIIGLSGGACTLGTSTATLAEALASEEALDRFAAGVPGGRDAVEDALRDGLRGGIDLAEQNDAFGGVTSFLLGQVIARTPLLGLLDAVRGQVG